MTKKCPKCAGAPLKPTKYQGETIDVCCQCGGLWFEKNEVNRLIEEVNDGPVGECFTEHFGEHLGETDLKCPSCREPMQAHHLLKDYRHEIDVCRSCDGTWIDKDELVAVEKSPELRETLDRLNKKISWKTYLFQFLTQMPVEYNVKPKITPWVTWSLIALNILIFVGYAFNDDAFFWMLDHFAMTPMEISEGREWWTLVTATFLHGGWLHLAGNMYFLYVVGDNIESAVGHKKYLLLYLACGVLASMVSWLSDLSGAIPSVGASGAIAGFFAIYLMWFRHASLTFMFIVFQKKISPMWFFAIWLIINFVGMANQEQGVDFMAHIGGFFAGLAIGFAMLNKVLDQNPMINLLRQDVVNIQR